MLFSRFINILGNQKNRTTSGLFAGVVIKPQIKDKYGCGLSTEWDIYVKEIVERREEGWVGTGQIVNFQKTKLKSMLFSN